MSDITAIAMNLWFGLLCVLATFYCIDGASIDVGQACNSTKRCQVGQVCNKRLSRCEDPCLRSSCNQTQKCKAYNGKVSCIPIRPTSPGVSGRKESMCHKVGLKCGTNARCIFNAVSGTSACICKPWHEGNATVHCYKKPGCGDNSHCEGDQVCEDNECVTHLRVNCVNQCAQNAHCTWYRGEAICSCPSKLKGDPYVIRDICTPVPGNCVDEKGRWNHTSPACQKHYTIHSHKVTWHQAHKNCISQNTKLATVIDEDEQAALQRVVTDKMADSAQNISLWLGGIAAATKDKFLWINEDCEDLRFTKWDTRSGQPNTRVGGLDCIALNDFRWHNKNCKDTYGYVCESIGTPYKG